MEQTKYDVFISYSRKDYVDDAGNVLPDNILTKIKDNFKANGISYWFDEEGIYSGDEFASVLTKAIRNSKLFLFISSCNSNQSKWTSNEISTALEYKKVIIPFRIDDSPYNDSVMMKIISFDYIECKDEEKAINKLLRAVKHHLPKFDMFKKEGISQREQHAKGQSSGKEATGIDSMSLRHSSKRMLWAAIGFLMLIMVVIGTIAFCNKGQESETALDTATILDDSDNTLCQPVDLGLPSGILWGDRNVGAKSPTDFGNLYAWGEINRKDDYSKYTYVAELKPSGIITLAKHDAARSELGEEWSMPTEAQFKELLSECKWYWKKVNGHNGFDIVGKNGKHIFLPAAGWGLDTIIEYRNQYGYYWTAERSTNSQFARSLQFPKDGKGIVGNGYLYVGRSIRAVYVFDAVAD